MYWSPCRIFCLIFSDLATLDNNFPACKIRPLQDNNNTSVIAPTIENLASTIPSLHLEPSHVPDFIFFFNFRICLSLLRMYVPANIRFSTCQIIISPPVPAFTSPTSATPTMISPATTANILVPGKQLNANRIISKMLWRFCYNLNKEIICH